MPNLKSEQIRSDLSLDVAPDQALSSKSQEDYLRLFLGKENCEKSKILGRKVFVYHNKGKNFILLHLAVTYLGGNGQHPIYKKRVQLQSWYKDFCKGITTSKLPYDVRFIGIYHYQGLVIFVDFQKETYLSKRVHNSSAHIYTNDLFQALKNGVFYKEDSFGNHIYTIRANKLIDYLTGNTLGQNVLFSLFEKFNSGFSFGRWLNVLPTVKEMRNNNWPQWKQKEWPGWYLEYKFERYSLDKKVSPYIKYTGTKNKRRNSKLQGQYDFDLWFKKQKYYGDLKASDLGSKMAPGNDQKSFIECINLYDKFWYIIYEHETQKDTIGNNYKNVRAYNKYISSVVPNSKKGELSYANRLKIGVKFVKMTILELNRINFREALKEFNQGHQPDGSARNPKFLIKKKDIDRFVVFRFNYHLK